MAFFLLCFTIFIMFLQPVFIWPWMEAYQPLRNSAILAMVAYLFSKKQKQKSFFSNKINVFFVLFVVMQVVSSSKLWLTGGLETFNLWLRVGIIYYLLTRMVNSEKRIKWVLISIMLGILYLSYFSLNTFVINYRHGMRAGGFGLYENSNDIAIILVTTIPLLIALANTAKSAPVKYFFLFLACILGFNILFTGSRNGLLGLITVGILSIVLSKQMPKLLRLGILVLLIASIFTVGLTNVLGRGDLTTGLSGDESSENRIEQWKAGYRMTRAHPFFGIGPGEFTSEAGSYDGIQGLEPHNTFIKVFAESGVAGGLFFLIFSILPLKSALPIFKGGDKNGNTGIYYKFLIISLLGFWVCAFFSNRYQFYILYVLVALTVSQQAFLAGEKT